MWSRTCKKGTIGELPGQLLFGVTYPIEELHTIWGIPSIGELLALPPLKRHTPAGSRRLAIKNIANISQ